MSEKLRTTGYNKNTAESYVINAAVVYTNVQYDKEKNEFTGDLHGATNGGVTLNVELEYREIEVDGAMGMSLKGNKVLEKGVATITANVKELTAESIRRSVNGTIEDASTDEAPEGYKVIKGKVIVESDDYINNMAVVGRLSGSSDPVIAILDNVLCTSGLEMGTEDNNEAVVEQVYEAHATHEQLENEEFPWRVYYPEINTSVEEDDDEEEGEVEG